MSHRHQNKKMTLQQLKAHAIDEITKLDSTPDRDIMLFMVGNADTYEQLIKCLLSSIMHYSKRS